MKKSQTHTDDAIRGSNGLFNLTYSKLLVSFVEFPNTRIPMMWELCQKQSK